MLLDDESNELFLLAYFYNSYVGELTNAPLPLIAHVPLPLVDFLPLGPQGASFNTPECVLVRSKDGVGGMSRVLHRLYLDRLIPRTWADERPPVLLNSWEAKYFGVNHTNIVEMAHQV